MPAPIFAYLLCRMRNGTVARVRTHRVEFQPGDAPPIYRALYLSHRQRAMLHHAVRVTAPDVHGNASRALAMKGSR